MKKNLKTLGLTLLAAATLALTGCGVSATIEAEPDTSVPAETIQPSTRAECATAEGVWAQIDVESESNGSCVEVAGSITALATFESTGVEFEAVKTSDQFFACRIDGFPAADETLEYEDESYTPDCAGFGPAWAWWALYVDTGDGWEFAMEGAQSQQLEPGQAIAFVWQFGDTSEPVLPHSG